MSEKYHLLLSANKNYMEQTTVCMSSILRNNRGKRLHFHIFHSEIDDETLEQINNWLKKESDLAELSLYQIQPDSYVFPIKPGDTISCETYFRILASEQLPKDLDKILYVDGDTLCLGDLTELWVTDIEGYAAASREVSVPEYRKRNLGITEGDFYFQAGVMLINLRWWRAHNTAEETLRFIEMHQDILPRWDQDALNAVLAGKVKRIHQKWNILLDTVSLEQWKQENPVIVHYTGVQLFKPWFKNSVSEYQSLYLEYRKDTPYQHNELKMYMASYFSFPFRLVPSNSRIVLYGAGQFGKAYYLQNLRCGFCEIVSWIDSYSYGKEVCGKQIHPLIALLDMQYDYILIAVAAESLAEDIKDKLTGIGIESEKILWEKPLFEKKVTELNSCKELDDFLSKSDNILICGCDEITVSCLSFLARHNTMHKISKIIIDKSHSDLKEILNIEIQDMDEYIDESAQILIAADDRMHMVWTAELYDRGHRDIYILSHKCYMQMCKADADRVNKWEKKRLSF